jgi:D-alanyl-D-alanine carboxypeptidase
MMSSLVWPMVKAVGDMYGSACGRAKGPMGRSLAALVGAVVVTLLLAAPAWAQVGSDRYSSIIIDARTGQELSSVNADEERHPASLTKMMTLYMVFEALRDRRLTLDQPVPVSGHAASQVPTKLGLVPGTKLTVEQAILGLVTMSANDAAAALGELLGGEEFAFAQMMTLRAHALGMTHTNFRNASGLPDPDQVSTARDLAVLGRRLITDFPAEYRYFSTPSFRFHGRMIPNHDRMLQTYPGADGIKTGFVTASGYNLVTSAMRSDVRLIGVVMGAKNAVERDVHMASLLNQGFERMDVPAVVAAGKREAPRLVASVQSSAQAALAQPRPTPSKWAVQVGAFATEAAARQAGATARRLADAGQVRVESTTVQGHTTWRAQLVGMNAAEANGTCSALTKRKLACVVLKPETGQLARNM